MIEQFAGVGGMVVSECLELNRASKPVLLVSHMIARFARDGEVWANVAIGTLAP